MQTIMDCEKTKKKNGDKGTHLDGRVRGQRREGGEEERRVTWGPNRSSGGGQEEERKGEGQAKIREEAVQVGFY